MRVIWIIGLLIGSAVADTALLNNMTDQLLQSARSLIQQDAIDTMKIPDMNKHWNLVISVFKFNGILRCRDGWVKSPSSIERASDATMTTKGDKVTLNVLLGFGNLEFGFRSCNVKTYGKTWLENNITSKAYTTIYSNSVELQLSLKGHGAQCVASVDHIVLKNLGNLNIHIGGHYFYELEEQIKNWTVGHFQDYVVDSIVEKLSDAARCSISKLDLCSKIPPLSRN
ncbi:uncharacterized protein LOC106673693 [Cimex lectularius]|uniref:Uncharacterized protein n=1 Tax=Cimex lectularius TaxID=79782 RepID=A0A8I6S8L2_CIMLE|nr:uncharacterized protein LOC106673693 [Cimex lectularius]